MNAATKRHSDDGNDTDEAGQVGRNHDENHPTSAATDTDDCSYPSLFRVLCLHDADSNAFELSQRLDAMAERLFRNHGIDLVFVNGPLLGRQQDRHDSPETEQSISDAMEWSKRHEAQPRVWWEVSELEGRSGNALPSDMHDEGVDDGASIYGDESREMDVVSSETKNTKQYVGLDASLLLLRQMWTSTPFFGILAFGQGASVASFLPLMAVSPTPGFCIFVDGTTILDEEELLVAHHMPCLHILGEWVV
jgi:hypothetical protein